MLVAHLDNRRIEAVDARKGPEYRCPECRRVLILRKGRIRIDHFAHKPPVACAWGRGETDEHREAKRLFRDAFAARGLRADVEVEVPSLPGDRRADVMVWSPAGQAFAIELQHTGASYDDLERRTLSYLRAGVRVVWVPFLRAGFVEQSKPVVDSADGDLRIERYPARPLEKWVHGFTFGRLWLYDPQARALWQASLSRQDYFVDHVFWYDDQGEERHVGGYWKASKRWRELTLRGPFGLDKVRLKPARRPPTEMGGHRYPGGMIGTFSV